jgi:hypothetical protein
VGDFENRVSAPCDRWSFGVSRRKRPGIPAVSMAFQEPSGHTPDRIEEVTGMLAHACWHWKRPEAATGDDEGRQRGLPRGAGLGARFTALGC